MDAVLEGGSRQHRVEGSTVSLTLLPVFLLMQPRILLTFWGSKCALLSHLDGCCSEMWYQKAVERRAVLHKILDIFSSFFKVPVNTYVSIKLSCFFCECLV